MSSSVIPFRAAPASLFGRMSAIHGRLGSAIVTLSEGGPDAEHVLTRLQPHEAAACPSVTAAATRVDSRLAAILELARSV